MANIGEKAISILTGNLNLGRSYLITTVIFNMFLFFIGEASTNISRNTTPEGSNSATNSTENSSSHRWSNNRRSQLLKQHQGELNRVVFSDSRRLVIHVHQ